MSCAHYFDRTDHGDSCFSVDTAAITFGRGALAGAGHQARALGCRRVALFTDQVVAGLPVLAEVRRALHEAGVEAVVYDQVRIEPNQTSFASATAFYQSDDFDGAVSVGGGSVIDTAKAALVYATYPAPFLRYINQPIGEGVAVPGLLPPHIACPTTSGTGSECTGIAVCSVPIDGDRTVFVKTGLAHRSLRPRLALIDPVCTETLPASVVAISGFDVLCHAIESYTALPHTKRARPGSSLLRPMSQGANPFSDVGSLEAIRLCGRYLLRAIGDRGDHEARDQMMFAATLAGIAFGNAGVHVPHAMAYAIGGLACSLRLPDYPSERTLVPHGLAVVWSAPAAIRHLAKACPERHLRCAEALGCSVRDVAAEDAGALLSGELQTLILKSGLPVQLGAAGFTRADVPTLCEGASLQTRLLGNAPLMLTESDLAAMFTDSMAEVT